MSRGVRLLALCCLAAQAALAAPSSDEVRHQAVQELGRLNGVALHCKYLDQVRAMKEAVVANAPKQRSYGLAFDEATNDAFLATLRERRPCPGHGGFSAQVAAAIEALRDLFDRP
jgi:hypothetical protein